MSTHPRSVRYLRRVVAALLIGLGWLAAHSAGAQQRRVVQFTGLVVSGDSLVGVPGAAVFVPQSRRAATTDANGYFSLVVLAGDSVVVASGDSRTYALVSPAYASASYSALVQLRLPNGGAPAAQAAPLHRFRRDFMRLRLPAAPGVVEQDELSRTYLKKTLNRLTLEREIEEKRNRNSALK